MMPSILKSNWERTKTHFTLDLETAKHLLSFWDSSPIQSLTLLSNGCANTNYKISFGKNSPPVVLRFYMRDKIAIYREKKLYEFVKDKIPLPAFLYTDDSCDFIEYPYAIVEYVEGVLMRDILLKGDERDIEECAFSAGIYLNILRHFKFSHAGFFEENLSIKSFSDDETYDSILLSLLEKSSVQEKLPQETLCSLKTIISNNLEYFPSLHEANLSHADYDPSNIIVQKREGRWIVSAILDWEFAFSGHYLLDIGMMLRYAHKLPPCYERSFIEGIISLGEPLPYTWKKSAKLMDLICLLQLLENNPAEKRPKMNKDIIELINHTISYFISP